MVDVLLTAQAMVQGEPEKVLDGLHLMEIVLDIFRALLVRMGDRLIDGSLKSRMKALEAQLLAD